MLTFIDRVVRDDAILDAVQSIIGRDILVWSSSFFIKEPHTRNFVSWHQDARYWGLEPHDAVSAWLALSPSAPHNGCMRFIPGSHRLGMLDHHDSFDDENMLTRGQMIKDIDESRVVDVVLRPGQMSVHHMRVVHGSRSNSSDERRVGLTITYMPTHVRQTTGLRDFATLVRGDDRYHHFESGRPPAGDMEAETVAFYHRVYDTQQAVLYRGGAQIRNGFK